MPARNGTRKGECRVLSSANDAIVATIAQVWHRGYVLSLVSLVSLVSNVSFTNSLASFVVISGIREVVPLNSDLR
jgi:hypothetical protein